MVAINALQAFRAIDGDGSGGISLKELKNGQIFGNSGLRAAISKSDAQTVFKSMDADKSGALSQTELAEGLAKLAPDTAGALLAAQEQQSDISQLLNGLKVGAYSTLPGLNDTGNTAFNILKAYYKLA